MSVNVVYAQPQMPKQPQMQYQGQMMQSYSQQLWQPQVEYLQYPNQLQVQQPQVQELQLQQVQNIEQPNQAQKKTDVKTVQNYNVNVPEQPDPASRGLLGGAIVGLIGGALKLNGLTKRINKINATMTYDKAKEVIYQKGTLIRLITKSKNNAPEVVKTLKGHIREDFIKFCKDVLRADGIELTCKGVEKNPAVRQTLLGEEASNELTSFLKKGSKNKAIKSGIILGVIAAFIIGASVKRNNEKRAKLQPVDTQKV